MVKVQISQDAWHWCLIWRGAANWDDGILFIAEKSWGCDQDADLAFIVLYKEMAGGISVHSREVFR